MLISTDCVACVRGTETTHRPETGQRSDQTSVTETVISVTVISGHCQ